VTPPMERSPDFGNLREIVRLVHLLNTNNMARKDEGICSGCIVCTGNHFSESDGAKATQVCLHGVGTFG